LTEAPLVPASPYLRKTVRLGWVVVDEQFPRCGSGATFHLLNICFHIRKQILYKLKSPFDEGEHQLNLLGHWNEITKTACYKRHPREAALYTWAKWAYARHRVHSPQDLIANLGFTVPAALSGLEHWFPLLADACEKVRAQEGHHGGVSIDDGVLLYGITRVLQPDVAIETGVAAGVSNSFINAALLENGHGVLYSVELPPCDSAGRQHEDGGWFDWPRYGVAWAVPPRIRDAIGDRNKLILEDVRTALPALLKTVHKVDLFFHDDLHTPQHMKWEYDLVWPHISPGGVLISDDSDYGWIRFCREQHMGSTSLLNLQRLTAVRKPPFSRA
jgi:predicted O-methyltransferase YrrM